MLQTLSIAKMQCILVGTMHHAPPPPPTVSVVLIIAHPDIIIQGFCRLMLNSFASQIELL